MQAEERASVQGSTLAAATTTAAATSTSTSASSLRQECQLCNKAGHSARSCPAMAMGPVLHRPEAVHRAVDEGAASLLGVERKLLSRKAIKRSKYNHGMGGRGSAPCRRRSSAGKGRRARRAMSRTGIAARSLRSQDGPRGMAVAEEPWVCEEGGHVQASTARWCQLLLLRWLAQDGCVWP